MSNQEMSQEANDVSQAGEGEGEATPRPDELKMLKERASRMGITFSNNIGLEALRAKVNGKLVPDDPGETAEPEKEVDEDDDIIEDDVPDLFEPFQSEEYVQTPEEMALELQVLREQVAKMAARSETSSLKAAGVNPLSGVVIGEKEPKLSPRQMLRRESMRLLRCRITNLDPKKKDLHGEIFCVGNRMIGTVKKFIPYGEMTDNGYHIPKILYDELESRKFLHVQTRRNKTNGQIDVRHSYAKEFSIEVLPPLTREELAQLAAQQMAASSAANN